MPPGLVFGVNGVSANVNPVASASGPTPKSAAEVRRLHGLPPSRAHYVPTPPVVEQTVVIPIDASSATSREQSEET